MYRDKFTDYAMFLDFAIENGILDVDTIREQAMKRQREQYMAMHKNKVWQAASGYWYTELPPRCENEKRKLVKKKNREDLEDTIVDFYQQQEEAPTFSKCFDAWLKQKTEYKEIVQGTVDRYKQDYNRFIKGTELAKRPIDRIQEEELEEFIRKQIADKNLTAKGYANMRTIIMGVFKYAKRKGYTKMSISQFFGDLELSRKAFTKKQKKPQVFSQDEASKIIDWLKDNPSVENYGLLLTFETGIRTAELAGLKFSDQDGRWLHIQRQEVRHKISGTQDNIYEVVDYTKTEAGDRWIALPPTALETIKAIKELNPDGEFMMMTNGRKVKKINFNDKLYKACEKCGVEKKSMHKIRKTYGTTLLNSGVDDIFITSQMGHEDVSTTRKYYYDLDKKKEIYLDQIQKVVTV